MTKKFGFISFISLLAVLGIVIMVSSLNVSAPEVAAVPTQALLPSVVPATLQPTVQPTPLPQEAPPSAANSVAADPLVDKAVVPEAVASEKQLDAPIEQVADPVQQPVENALASQPQTTAVPAVIPLPPAPVPNQIVIHFDPAASAEQRAAYIQQIGGTVNQNIDALNTVVVNVPQGVSEQDLPPSASVKTSEPDYFVVALDAAPVNDPMYTAQWSLPIIGASNGWAALPANTPTVAVAVIDSGICAAHPDLVGRILPGYDFVDGDTVPQDDFGHGCGVSGIIAANPNNGIGIAGVAPNALIMPLRVLNGQGVGTYSDVAAALVYAADNGAKIANLSLGGLSSSTVLEDAVNYAVAHGVLVIAAAGNTGGSVLYPAAYAAVVAVASVDANLQRSSFSSYGPEVDLMAPGRDILTTTINGSYSTMSGTSFSAPEAAGIAALELAMGRTLTLDGNIVAFNGGTPVVQQPTVTPTVESITPVPGGANALFSAVNSATVDQLGLVSPANAHTKRARFVNVNANLLGSAADFTSKTQADSASSTIVLNLFDDVAFTAVRTTYSPMSTGNILWHGTLQGVDYGSVDLILGNGVLTGNVYLTNNTYEIRYAGQGNIHIVREVDPGSYPEERDDVTVQAAATGSDVVQPTADDGSIIDVLVIYTATARIGAGGTAAMLNTIDLAKQDTNQSYINSGINQRINVVNSTEVNYAETGNSVTDLICIQSQADGCLDNIHTLRNTYNADIVVFIEESVGAGLCGQAYNILGAGGVGGITHSFEQYAFLVVSRDCSVSNHSFAHELGHLMSARHDYYVDPTNNGPYTYNHGFVYTPGRWRTIMAYNNACADLGFNCTRLQFWSNPNVLYTGIPMGIAEGQANAADNRKALNNTALTVANFRVSNSAPVPDDFDNATIISTANFTSTIQTLTATTAADDPTYSCIAGQRYNTVWYRLTPAAGGDLTVHTIGSDYDTVLAVWTGARGSLTSQACNDDIINSGTAQSQVSLHVDGGTTYYIEVASYSLLGGTLNLTSSLVVPPTPAAPVLTAPGPNGISLNNTTPTFTWNSVANGVQYHIQVDNNTNFSSPEAESTQNTLTFTPASALVDGVYSWRVQALNSNAVAGAWSAVWNFTLDTVPTASPVLIAPINNPPPSINNKPVFSWQPVTGAVRYQIRLDTVNPPLVVVQDAVQTSYTPTSGLSEATYYWCVTTIDLAGNLSDCIEVRSLFIVSEANAYPPRNLYNTYTPTLTWNRVTWANGYQLVIDNNADFLSSEYNSIIDSGSTLSHTVLFPLANGTYYWRMRARKVDGTWGTWSPADSFVIVGP